MSLKHLRSIRDVEVPQVMGKFARIELLLDQLTSDNIRQIQLEITQLIDGEEDYSELISLILAYVEARPLDLSSFATLTVRLAVRFTQSFSDEILKRSRALFNRQLFDLGLFTIGQISERIKTYTDLAYFYLPELGKNVVDLSKENYRFIHIQKRLQYYEKNDWEAYKDFLTFGYQRNTLGYALKYDKVEIVESIAIRNKNELREMVDVGLFEGFGAFLMPLCGAAYYGSNKVFKFMVRNAICCIDQNIDKYCVQGGSFDIIEICEKSFS